MSVVDGGDEDSVGFGDSQLGHDPSCPAPQGCGNQTARGDPEHFNEPPKGEEYMERIQYYNKEILGSPSQRFFDESDSHCRANTSSSNSMMLSRNISR